MPVYVCELEGGIGLAYQQSTTTCQQYMLLELKFHSVGSVGAMLHPICLPSNALLDASSSWTEHVDQAAEKARPMLAGSRCRQAVRLLGLRSLAALLQLL